MLALLAVLPLLAGGPTDVAELGGVVAASRQPVELNLYSGSERVATAHADAFGRYVLRSPPGDYWLQVRAGGQETAVERVAIPPGTWRRDLAVALEPLK
jgi:hypothetical protein